MALWIMAADHDQVNSAANRLGEINMIMKNHFDHPLPAEVSHAAVRPQD